MLSPKLIIEIEYKLNEVISVDQFLCLLDSSTLGKRRKVDDIDCIQGMLENSNLLVAAWHGSKLVGIARSMTDFTMHVIFLILP